MGEVDGGAATKLLNGDGDNESLASVCFATASTDPTAAKDLEAAITAYLRRATENFDLSKNVEVCEMNEKFKTHLFHKFISFIRNKYQLLEM